MFKLLYFVIVLNILLKRKFIIVNKKTLKKVLTKLKSSAIITHVVKICVFSSAG